MENLQPLLKLSSQAGGPVWIQLVPEAEFSYQGQPVSIGKTELRAMFAALRRGQDMVIDYEHQSIRGEVAPAAGWIKDFSLQPEGLFGLVEWNEKARLMILAGEYKYLSPVLHPLVPDQDGVIRPKMLINAAVTNVPHLENIRPLAARLQPEAAAITPAALSAGKEGTMKELEKWLTDHPEQPAEKVLPLVLSVLNRVAQGESADVLTLRLAAATPEPDAALKPLCEILGLPASSRAEEVKAAVLALTLKAPALDELGKLRQELEALKNEKIKANALALVNGAIDAGKITPAQKPLMLRLAETDPELVENQLKTLPQIVPLGEISKQTPPVGGVIALTACEIKYAKKLGLDPAKVLAARKSAGMEG